MNGEGICDIKMVSYSCKKGVRFKTERNLYGDDIGSKDTE
jgi:hypothetical protein